MITGVTEQAARVSERFTELSTAVIARGAGPSNGDRFGWFNAGCLGRRKRGRDVQRSHPKVDADTASAALDDAPCISRRQREFIHIPQPLR